MSARARQILGVSLLLLVFVVTAARAGTMLLGHARPEPFDADVTVVVAATPNIYADNPEVRVQQLIASMNDMWRRAFAVGGEDYADPRIEPRRGRAASSCGRDVSGWAGLYCHGENRVVIDLASHLVRRAAVGDDRSDDLLGYVLAHEVAHHVQAQRGLTKFTSQEDTVRAELHAECLAGVWGKAAGKPVPAHDVYVTDADHGTAEQQIRWLETGYAAGRPAACDPVWDD